MPLTLTSGAPVIADNTTNPIKRLNYFYGQFLQEADFTAEQTYHMNQRQRLARLLQSPGVLEGMEVTAVEGNLKISAGTAVDTNGCLIVLTGDQLLTVSGDPDSTKTLTIRYTESPTDIVATEPSGATRCDESPSLALADQSTVVGQASVLAIALASLTFDHNGAWNGQPDSSVRVPATLRAGYLTVSDLLTATSGLTVSGGDLTVSTGTLSVNGMVTADGGLTVAGGDVTVSTGGLTVSGMLNANGGLTVGSGDLAVNTGGLTVHGTVTANGGLTVAGGDLTVSTGSLTVAGGDLTVSTGSLSVRGMVNANGGLTVGSGDLTVSIGNLTVPYGDVSVSAGNLSVHSMVTANGGLTVGSGGLTVGSGDLTVSQGSLTVSSLLTAKNRLTVESGDLTVSQGNLTVSGGTVNIGGDGGATGATLVIAPPGSGWLQVGNKETGADDYTSVSMGITSEKNGTPYIQGICAAGSGNYGYLWINPHGQGAIIGHDPDWANDDLSQLDSSKAGNNTLYVFGSIGSSVGKQFVIPHPTRPGYSIVHGSLEGPEFGVYYRGVARLRDGCTIVRLPEYFEALTCAEGRTVQLTPVGEQPFLLSYTPVIDGAFSVYSDRRDGVFAWQVMAVRADVLPLAVEVANNKQRDEE
jgi:hypothetical protein